MIPAEFLQDQARLQRQADAIRAMKPSAFRTACEQAHAASLQGIAAKWAAAEPLFDARRFTDKLRVTA